MSARVVRHDGVSPFTVNMESEKIPDLKLTLYDANVQNVTAADLHISDLGNGLYQFLYKIHAKQN